jgi:hypothetical protein
VGDSGGELLIYKVVLQCFQSLVSLGSGLKVGAITRDENDSSFVISNRIYPREKYLMKSISGTSFIRMFIKIPGWLNGYKKIGVFDFRRDFSSSPRRLEILGSLEQSCASVNRRNDRRERFGNNPRLAPNLLCPAV